MKLLGVLFVTVLITDGKGFAGSSRVNSLQNAAALIAQHNLTAAEEILGTLLAEQKDGIGLNLLGVVRVEQQRPAEAEELFKQAAASGEHIVGPHVNLAKLYSMERPLEAISECAQALKIAPENKECAGLVRTIATEGALRKMQQHNTSGALAMMNAARNVLPEDPELLYQYGMVAADAGLNKEARNALEQAIKLRPLQVQAHYALARVLLSENLASEAEAEMRLYLAAMPGDASAQYGLGYILIAEQKVDEAKMAFEKSVMLQPNQTESVFQLGEIAEQEGKTVDAQTNFDKVLKLDDRHAGALTEVGVLAYKSGDYENARQRLLRAIASDPAYQKAHYYYALSLAKLGNKPEAQHEFEIARSLQKPHGAP